MNRRQCLAVLSAASAEFAVHAAPQTRVIGAQTYQIRGPMRREPTRILKTIAGFGYRELEVHSRQALATVAPVLKDVGLTVRSCMVETPLFTANWDSFPDLKQVTVEEVADNLASVGVEYMLLGDIPAGARGDGEDFFRRTADRLNVAADKARKSGVKVAWQNRGYEFEGRPGRRPIDFYKERLDGKLVGMELDTFWAAMVAVDPVKLMKDWKGRVSGLRLNDRAKGVKPGFEAPGQGAFAEAGQGDLDFPAVLKAAAAAGVRVYSTGQELVEGDPLEGLRRNFEYFKLGTGVG